MSKWLRYNVFLIVLFFLSIATGEARLIGDVQLDVLTKKLSVAISDTNRITILLELSRQLMFKPGVTSQEIDNAYLLVKQAQNISFKINAQRCLGNTLIMAALIQNRKGRSKEGLASAEGALKIFKKINDLPDQAEAYIMIGQHYGNEGDDLAKKMAYYQKAINIFLNIGLKLRAATTLKDLGDFQISANLNDAALKSLNTALAIYQSKGYKDLQGVYDLLGYDLIRMGDHINGLKYGLLAVKAAESVNDTSLQLGTIYNRVAISFYLSKQMANANVYFRKALHIAKRYYDRESIESISANLATALALDHKYKESITITEGLEKYVKTSPNSNLEVEVNFIYLKDYSWLKNYQSAKVYFMKLKAASARYGPSSEIQEKILRGIIFYLQETGQYGLSYAYIRKHEDFCTRNKLYLFLSNEHLWWFKADSATGKYISAIRQYQKYKANNDSVFSENNNKQTALLQIQYETDKKDKDILLKSKDIQILKKKTQLQEDKSRQDQVLRNIILTSAFMLVLLLGVVYNRYRLKQRNNLMLQAQQAEINEQNESLMILNSKQNALIVEKEWLLREIHHRVKNNLQITMSLLNIQSAYLVNDVALDAILNSQRRMQAMSLIHQRLYQSDNLAYINMSFYIPELVNYLKESFDDVKTITFELNTPSLELDIAQAVPLGLILNEAITNSIKYAFPERQTGKITISIIERPDRYYVLSIADNGVGMPEISEGFRRNSLGMNLMQGLTDQLQGEFSIENVNGTVITIVFAGIDLMFEELHSSDQTYA